MNSQSFPKSRTFFKIIISSFSMARPKKIEKFCKLEAATLDELFYTVYQICNQFKGTEYVLLENANIIYLIIRQRNFQKICKLKFACRNLHIYKIDRNIIYFLYFVSVAMFIVQKLQKFLNLVANVSHSTLTHL